jgi:hypothetical protein
MRSLAVAEIFGWQPQRAVERSTAGRLRREHGQQAALDGPLFDLCADRVDLAAQRFERAGVSVEARELIVVPVIER